jgi:plastocyanin domain-containing protein
VNQKAIAVSIISVAVLIGGGIFLLTASRAGTDGQPSRDNVAIVDGKQVIEIDAKGGYFPNKTAAQANIPTVLKIKTNSTFDCSSAVRIPSINYQAYLPPSGETIIELPPQEEDSTLQGLCAMGMYNFSLSFN